VRHHGDADTPGPAAPPLPPGRDEAVASVARVTRVAQVAAGATSTSGPLPAAPAPDGRPRPGGAVIRPLPTERPAQAAPPPARAATAAPVVQSPPAAPRRGPGKREIKRQETRARIVDAAAELFAERGFDAVSVQEIARRAGVVEKTVFNHFPVKEGLVFEADPPMRAALLETVRRRPAGESVSAAAGTFVVSAISLLGSPEAADGVARMARIVRGSRTLQVREREIIDELTEALAALIAEETDAQSGQLEPWLSAHAVLGLYAGLLELARDRVLAGVTGAPLAAELRRRGQKGLSLLQFGLAGYAKRR
jgi:AcrR family transcriptional regulator